MGFYKKILAWFCVLFLCLSGCGKSSQQNGSSNQSGSDNTTETSSGNTDKDEGKTEDSAPNSDNEEDGKTEDGASNSGSTETGASQDSASNSGNTAATDGNASKPADNNAGTNTAGNSSGPTGSAKLGDKDVTVQLENNESVEALKQISPLTVTLSPYGDVELSGYIGTTIPSTYDVMTTSPGDIVLYNGDTLIVVTKPNTCSYTKIGRITGMSESELADLLSKGNVTLTLDFR